MEDDHRDTASWVRPQELSLAARDRLERASRLPNLYGPDYYESLIAQYEEKNKELRAEVESLSAEETQFNKSKISHKLLEMEVKKLEKHIHLQNKEIMSSKEDNKNLRVAMEDIRSVITKQKHIKDRLAKDLEANKLELANTADALSQNIEVTQKELTDTTRSLRNQLGSREKELRETRQSLSQNLASKEKELYETKYVLARETEAKENVMQEAFSMLDELRERQRKMEDRHAKARKALDHRFGSVLHRERLGAKLRNERSRHTIAVKTLQAQRSQLLANHSRLSTQLKGSHARYDIVMVRVEQLYKQIHDHITTIPRCEFEFSPGNYLP
ncbi:hypothetical protein BKA67DRAFT_660704 [Truncatella angustata]|uniref:Uncharacterized protein n=1 Tax=Truncatella angustata TaxID=152316 RepID=A0A9P8UGT3_9PEZI|nr:uncharacterized protein BKA67DRAFT_660704 [Truncatella angustata]KAH6651925.1 hypothetical protein BKA67DRAFT_660704 [Truncatella angustata]KAH8205654.1 hypothetical protein TruAng_000148 [Truncatella angustata]